MMENEGKTRYGKILLTTISLLLLLFGYCKQ